MEKVTVKDRGDITVIAVQGDIEFDDALELNDILKSLLEKDRIKLVFNLKKCNYIDSSGLGALVEGLKESHRRAGDLRLCYLNGDFKDVLTMTRTIKYFQIYNDEESAIDSYK